MLDACLDVVRSKVNATGDDVEAKLVDDSMCFRRDPLPLLLLRPVKLLLLRLLWLVKYVRNKGVAAARGEARHKTRTKDALESSKLTSGEIPLAETCPHKVSIGSYFISSAA